MITRTHLSRIEQWMDLDDPSFVHDHFLKLAACLQLTACLTFSVDLFLRLRITARFNLSFPSFRYHWKIQLSSFFRHEALRVSWITKGALGQWKHLLCFLLHSRRLTWGKPSDRIAHLVQGSYCKLANTANDLTWPCQLHFPHTQTFLTGKRHSGFRTCSCNWEYVPWRQFFSHKIHRYIRCKDLCDFIAFDKVNVHINIQANALF